MAEMDSSLGLILHGVHVDGQDASCTLAVWYGLEEVGWIIWMDIGFWLWL